MATQLCPGVQIAAQPLFSESDVQLHNLGDLIHSSDGRSYRYVKAGGTALVPGKLQASAAETTGWQNLAVAAAAIGDTSITTTSTVTLTANQLSGGYVMVSVTPGQGYQYKIKSHPAVSSAVVTLQLEDPISVALTTSSRVDLVMNPYASVIVAPATFSGVPVGVAVYPITASYYGWVQVRGICNVLNDGGSTVGNSVSASASVAGAVTASTWTGILPVVGVAMTGISSTEYGAVNLQLA